MRVIFLKEMMMRKMMMNKCNNQYGLKAQLYNEDMISN
jgi:hypothetical protein